VTNEKGATRRRRRGGSPTSAPRRRSRTVPRGQEIPRRGCAPKKYDASAGIMGGSGRRRSEAGTRCRARAPMCRTSDLVKEDLHDDIQHQGKSSFHLGVSVGCACSKFMAMPASALPGAPRPRPRQGGGEGGERGSRFPLGDSGSESDSDGETRSREGVRRTKRVRQEERQADGGSGDDEEPGEQHGRRSELGARPELSATGAQDAPT